MSDDSGHVPDTIFGVSFDDVYRAEEFMTAAMRLRAQHKVELRDAVRIVKGADGKAHVRETIDPQPGTSALTTGMWAGLFGLLLGGPVGWLAGTAVGAGAGAVRAKVVDLGIPDEWVKWFRDAVQPGTATVVLLIGRYDREAVSNELARFAGAHLVYANLSPDTIAGIRKALGEETLQPAEEPPHHPA